MKRYSYGERDYTFGQLMLTLRTSGHPGDVAISPLVQQAHSLGIVMEYQNVDAPKVRSAFGGGYIGADIAAQGAALGRQTISLLGLKAGDKAIVFGTWGEPGRYLREERFSRVRATPSHWKRQASYPHRKQTGGHLRDFRPEGSAE